MNKRTLKNIGLTALAVACPPAFVAQMNIRDKTYETNWGKAVGTTLGTALAAGLTWLGTIFYEGIVVNDRTEKRNNVEHSWVAPGQNLNVRNTKGINPSSRLLYTQLLTPWEAMGRDVTGTFPTRDITYVTGTLTREGLDYEIDAKLPGKRTSQDITATDVYKGIRNVKLSENSYKAFFRQ